MSSIDHDRLLHEGPEPRSGTRSPLATQDRRPADPAGEQAGQRIPEPRRGDAPTGTGTPTVHAARVETVDDVRELACAAEARSLAAVQGVPAGDEPAAAVVVVKGLDAGTGAIEAGARRRRRPRRRPELYLTAALVGGLGFGAISLGPAAQADPVEAQSHSVSVAEELGISADSSEPVTDPATTERLQELAVSRVSREDEQAAAAEAQVEADRVAAAAAVEAARPKAVLPVDGARLSSTFGARWGTLHAGIDLAAPMLTPEYAAADGIVLEAGPASGFGLAVYVQHQNGDVTVYGHMEKILARPGQVVKAGDTIALVGNRGQSTGPHLHLEVHEGGINGPKLDPIPWLRERGVRI